MPIKQLVVRQLTSFRFISPVTHLAVRCPTSESQMLNRIPKSLFLTLISLSLVSTGKYKSQLFGDLL